MHAPETQVSPEMVQAAADDEHLQIPLPLLADASQYSPVLIPAQDASVDVHLQVPLPLLAEASQYDPVVRPAHDASAEVHLQTLFEESQ